MIPLSKDQHCYTLSGKLTYPMTIFRRTFLDYQKVKPYIFIYIILSLGIPNISSKFSKIFPLYSIISLSLCIYIHIVPIISDHFSRTYISYYIPYHYHSKLVIYCHYISIITVSCLYIPIWLLVSHPPKNMKVSWDDSSQHTESHKIHVPNHQPNIPVKFKNDNLW